MKHLLHDVKQVLRTCLVITVLLSAAITGKAQTSQQGTAEDPIIISDEAGLKAMANGLDKHYKLGQDITLTEAWTPIGVNPFFTGTLDGDGHKIAGLYTEVSTKGGAIIATNYGGTVKNLGVEITGNGIRTTVYGAGIVGQNVGTISNCYVTGTSIYVESIKRGNCSAGGIAGRSLDDGGNEGIVLNCYSSVQTITTNRMGDSGDKYTGGIVGENYATISGCLALNGKLIFQENGQPAYYGGNGAISNDFNGSYANNFAWYKTESGVTSSDRPYSGIPWDGTAPNDEAWSILEENLVLKGGTNATMIKIPISPKKYLKGKGTEAEPYLIKEDADLRKLSDYTNNTKNTCKDTFYKLESDIQMSNEPFTPINNKTYSFGIFGFRIPFSGTFDGNGKKISNLYINSSEIYNGLFGTVEGCTIKNLGLEACDINVTFNGKAVVSIGAIIGADYTISQAITKPSTIENCFATGSVKMLGNVEEDFGGGTGCVMGGLVGVSSLITVLNCYTDLSLSNEGTGTATSYTMGGIVGRVDVNAKDENDLVKNCYVLGNIITTQKNGVSIGGLVGFASENKKITNNLVLCNKIENTNQSFYGKRIAVSSTKEENLTNNYALEQMLLIANGKIQNSSEIISGSALDGTNWDKVTVPSADDWTIENGYLNLNSIKTTFGNNQQIKLANYDPHSITVDSDITNGAIQVDFNEAIANTTVALTITPDQGYRLKDNSLKAFKTDDETTVVTITENTFTMPAHAVTLTAEFEIDSLRLDDITESDSLLISQTEGNWFYTVKASTSTTMMKSIVLGSPYPFNGVIKGVLTDNKAIVFEPSCKGDLTFDDVTVPALVVKQGASVVLGTDSKLSYTTLDNEGGTLVAREGATLNAGGTAVNVNVLTITTSQNGTLTVKAGNVAINSGDRIAENTQFTVTATAAANYLVESVTVQGSTEVIAPDADGNYTMPNEVVTVSAVFKYNPPYIPPYVPEYYTVTLPAVEGATTNPKAGDYTIQEGYNFSFALTLADGYAQSVPVVKANGQTITPRTSDGKYVVKNIYEDTAITIEGIVPDTPTANAEIKNGTEVFVREGVLHIRLDNTRKVIVANAGGQVVRNVKLPAGENTVYGIQPGFYMVQVEGQAASKVIIR